MRRKANKMRSFLKKAKEILLHKSKGFNDMVYMATAIISTVIVAMIGVYISAQIYDVMNLEPDSPFQTAMQGAINIMNTTYPLLVVVAIGIIAGIVMSYLLGGFGVAGGSEKQKGQ
ncbi:MAG: hypothetical protein OCU22_10110 [Canidatus Methanoxibalbensis ujae]|nr:hypothetical protein [Candidatus Methanoxibalbensis ujae]